ncbi:MAG: CBS domain-containing protein [Deltaproteobacteria bacterium]|nr:CBS domain-containing protein [Deltaproteobacteria bacterium]
MSKPISEYMTAAPHTIGKTQTLDVAHKLMSEHGIHHLPVLHSGGLVGMVTLRDLDLVESFDALTREELAVEEAMSTEVYVVAAETTLTEVVGTMVERKISSAIIADANNRVEGVFTNSDALKALHDQLSK